MQAGKINDNNYETYFATDDSVTTATIDIELGKPVKIDGFILQEYIPLGQRVDEYSIECRVDGKWTPVFTGKKSGTSVLFSKAGYLLRIFNSPWQMLSGLLFQKPVHRR